MADLLNEYQVQNGDENMGSLSQGQTNRSGAQTVPTTQQKINYGWGTPKESNSYILPVVVVSLLLLGIALGLLIYKRHKTSKIH